MQASSPTRTAFVLRATIAHPHHASADPILEYHRSAPRSETKLVSSGQDLAGCRANASRCSPLPPRFGLLARLPAAALPAPNPPLPSIRTELRGTRAMRGSNGSSPWSSSLPHVKECSRRALGALATSHLSCRWHDQRYYTVAMSEPASSSSLTCVRRNSRAVRDR